MKVTNIIIAVMAAALFTSLAFLIIKPSEKPISFADSRIATSLPEPLINASGYISIPALSASPESLRELLGNIVSRDSSNPQSSWQFNPMYRPKTLSPVTTPINEKVFSGLVSTNTATTGQFGLVKASLSEEDIAEISIRNVLTMRIKDENIPLQELYKYRLSPGQEDYYISSIVVTEITSRRFRKYGGEGNIEGLAFSSDGKIYNSSENIEISRVVSFRSIRPFNLKQAEAGVANETAQLSQKARTGKLSESETAKLIQLLEKQSSLSGTIQLEQLPPALPEPLASMDQLIWLANTPAIKQSASNTCWAAATAMLLGYRENRLISEQEAAQQLGASWENLHANNNPLIRDYKLHFLQQAQFAYEAPQSYMPEGIQALLEQYGPIWFTIDLNEGRHASIVTGLFESKAHGHWLSYIDPLTGALEAESYGAFMHRYEAPAYRWNDTNRGAAITEQDLDIQVIHL